MLPELIIPRPLKSELLTTSKDRLLHSRSVINHQIYFIHGEFQCSQKITKLVAATPSPTPKPMLLQNMRVNTNSTSPFAAFMRKFIDFINSTVLVLLDQTSATFGATAVIAAAPWKHPSECQSFARLPGHSSRCASHSSRKRSRSLSGNRSTARSMDLRAICGAQQYSSAATRLPKMPKKRPITYSMRASLPSENQQVPHAPCCSRPLKDDRISFAAFRLLSDRCAPIR